MIEGAWGSSVTSTIFSSNSSSILAAHANEHHIPDTLADVARMALTNRVRPSSLPYRRRSARSFCCGNHVAHMGSLDCSHVLPVP